MKKANFLQVTSLFTLVARIIHSHIISFVIHMKYKNYGNLNDSCSLGLQTRIFPQAISPTHSVSSCLSWEERWKKRGGG
jgi:hypothetical protein